MVELMRLLIEKAGPADIAAIVLAVVCLALIQALLKATKPRKSR